MRKHFFTLLAMLLVFFQVRCADTPAPPAAENLDHVVLQLRWDHQFQFAGYYAADWQGFYRDEGLEVEIRPAVTPDGAILSATEQVTAGLADFGIGAADILIANDRDADLRVISTIFQRSAARFYYKPITPFTSLADLVDLRVARNVDDLIDVELQAMLLSEGIDPQQVTPYPVQLGIAHLLSDEVQVMPGYQTTAPYLAEREETLLRQIDPASYGIDFYGDSIFTSGDLVSQDPDLVERFVRASLKGWKFALNRPEETAKKISTQLARIDTVEDVEAFNLFQVGVVRNLTLYPLVELGHINPDRWGEMSELLTDIGLTTQKVDLKEFIFDPQAAQAARAQRWRNTLVWVLAITVFIFAIVIGWAYVLKKAVQQRTRELANELEIRIQAEAALHESEQKYRLLFENAGAGIGYFTPNGKIVAFNNIAARHMGGSVAGFNGKSLIELFGAEAGGLYQARIVAAANSSESQVYEDLISLPIGDKWFRSIYAGVCNAAGDMVGVQIISDDITERKRAEQMQDARLRLLELSASRSMSELLTATLDEAEALTGSTIGFYHFLEGDQQTLALQAWSSNTLDTMCAAEGEQLHYNIDEAGIWVDCIHQQQPVIHNDYLSLPHRNRIPEGHSPVSRELVVPVIRENRVVAILGVGNKERDYTEDDVNVVSQLADLAWDITDRKQIEEALRQKQAELLEAQRVAKIGNWWHDMVTDSIFWSDETFRILGLEPQPVTAELAFSCIHPDDRHILIHAAEEASRGKKETSHEFRIVRPNGEIRWIHNRWESTFNDNGTELKRIGTHQDITELKRTEEKLRISLKEKEVLLQELYHRTKNNMFVIKSLLALQSNYIHDQQALDAFADTQNRIQSMALVHQKLYQSKNLSSIDLKEYISDLVEHLMQSYGISSDRIAVIERMDSVPVLIDTAMPCGLIVNELISNALKHAFPHGQAGKITISLHENVTGEISLEVADNGVGVPAGFDLRKAGSLGVMTVFNLAEYQLRANVTFDTKSGVTYRITFVDNRYEPRV
jgi:PAS domain S-box-containing protein